LDCRLCGNSTNFVFSHKILNKHNINYYRCLKCDLIQTEHPYWLKEAYRNPISISDTGIFERNIRLSKLILKVLSLKKEDGKIKEIIRAILNKPKIRAFQGKILDVGGGYGILVRLLRDFGLDAYWEDKFSQNLFSKGFEKINNEKYDVVTAFEVWEHYDNPENEILKIFEDLKPEYIFISTTLYSESLPDLNWWYYSFETGQHISFYSIKTIEYIANLYSYNFEILKNDFIIFSRMKMDSDVLRKVENINEELFREILIRYKTKTYSDYQSISNKMKFSNFQ
jgi:2-polyprenyl-3-methyl-5-hydroxy-6-metoxy-1,4-benzoquinol methylase